mgnify:CR=1 FL=1
MAGNEKKADISMTGNKSGNPSIDGKTLKRLMSYIVGRHKLTFFMVVVCILISSCTVVVSSLFLQILIDNYITPMLSEVNPSFAPLLKTIIMLGCLYLVGVLSTFAYNKMMIKISQGTLKAIRDDMFTHMQTLPIRYFDTHTHGDVMSHYTNDTDTLRQFISQALPQFISAVVTIVVVIVSMIVNSIPLTILVLAVTCIMQIVSKKIGGASARYFIRQQITIGKVTGFIEEMINGQKVIKVFCHEDEAKYDFDKNNEMLCSDATNASVVRGVASVASGVATNDNLIDEEDLAQVKYIFSKEEEIIQFLLDNNNWENNCKTLATISLNDVLEENFRNMCDNAYNDFSKKAYNASDDCNNFSEKAYSSFNKE